MRLGKFTANIIVDGKALEEYDVVSESPTNVTCWVASEEGKSFGVQWKCHEEQRVTAAEGRVCVDGIECGRSAVTPGALGVNDTKIITQYIGGRATRDLMFARIQLSDDDSLLKKVIPKDLGDITLKIELGQIVFERLSDVNEVHVALDSTEKLHERSKKATVHRVGFGPEKARKPPQMIWRLRRNSEPTIEFVFKYRPQNVLQANGIAPRPASTDTGAASISEDQPAEPDVGRAEDIKPAHLNDRIQSLENQLKRLRALQADNSEDRKPKRIKTEEPQGRKLLLFAPGEIIDLT